MILPDQQLENPNSGNLAKGRVILKSNKSVLMQKILLHCMATFTLNLHTVYELNNWPRSPRNSFTLRNCLFGTVTLVWNIVKSKFIFNRRGTAFDGEGLRSFGNDIARNAVIFGVDNSSSSHTANQKKNF